MHIEYIEKSKLKINETKIIRKKKKILTTYNVESEANMEKYKFSGWQRVTPVVAKLVIIKGQLVNKKLKNCEDMMLPTKSITQQHEREGDVALA
ncbi:hypothetical protein Bhyg_11751 [Pseudolycoriella hygida]|uniref:Uncharacterized protein n=1 Tax=Pseudolycoriella hygida TaxID=35572 RepID=A0A9Q0MYI4_9DIPT|nr:hypothetical protein Bhyg_11751 [Pseudolycoriella hygida]